MNDEPKIHYQYILGSVSAETIQQALNFNIPGNSYVKCLSWAQIYQVYLNSESIPGNDIYYFKTYFSFYFQDGKPVLDRILTAKDFEKFAILG